MKFTRRIQINTNKDKSKEIFLPLLPKPLMYNCTYICACAMSRAKKKSAKGSNFKEDDSVFSL